MAGDIVLDPLRIRVSVGEASQDLTAREFALLAYLVRHAGEVVTRQQILDAVWGADPDVYSNVVDLYVHYLRQKLELLDRRDAAPHRPRRGLLPARRRDSREAPGRSSRPCRGAPPPDPHPPRAPDPG